jgi:hypothetical protein
MTLDNTLKNLEQIAVKFSPESEEYKSLLKASEALLLVQDYEVREQFRRFVKMRNRPLNGIEIIRLKMYDIDIPDEFKTPEVIALESKIDELVAEIQMFR